MTKRNLLKANVNYLIIKKEMASTLTTQVKNLNKAVTKLVDDVQALTLDKVLALVKTYVPETSLEKFTVEFEELKKTLKQDNVTLLATTDSLKKGASSERKKRVPSEYNIFIGSKIKELKEKNKEKNGKDLMKMAIEAWKARPAAAKVVAV
jgi:hypothetical protein